MATELKDTFMVDVLKQKLTDIEQNGRKFDLADYIKALKELQDKLTQLTTVQNVTFGQYNLDILADINSTALLAALMEQLNSVKNSYGDISVKIIESLLPKEEFQKVGLIMEKIVNIVKENIINMTSGSFTLNSMFVKIPLLHDIVSALNLSPDVLDVLLISPVVNPQRLAEVLLVPSTKEKFCEKSELWRDVLTLPATFNTSALNNAFCDQNTTNIINSLVKNLNLKTLITSLGNSSYEPDWKNVISQTQELVKNLNDLIANPPNFNFSKSLTGFQLYSSNTSKLWDFVSLYTTLNKIFENSSQFEAVQSQLKTLTVIVDVLNDILNKVKVTGVTLDLASLFKDSPSFTRMFKSFLSLNPDPVTGSLSIQLKPSQISAFSTVAADSNLLKDVFCNKSRFAEFFHVSGNVNITALLDSLCTVNFTNMATELKDTFMVDVLKQKLTDIEQNGRKFNLADYIKALKELQDKLTQLTTVQNVTFGQYSLDILADINSTALLAALMEQLNSVKNSYGDISVKIFDQIISLFRNSSSWRSLLVAFNAYDLILEHFNQYLTNIKGKPLSLELLVNNTDVDSLLIPLLKEPAWLSDLLKSSVKLDKLLNFVQSENATDILCSDELWDAFILPANGSAALKHLQDQACLMNKTILTWKTFVLQQLAYINKEADSGQLSLNSTKIGLDMKTAIELLTTMMSSIKDRTNLINQFINIDGFKSVLEKLNTTLTQRLSDLSNQWAMEAASLVWPSIKNNTAMTQMSNIISIANIFLDTINNKLSQVLANNISASSLLANSDELEKIVKAYINITKHDIDSWTNGNFSISKLTDLLRNSSLLTSKCADNSVAMYTSHSNNPPQFATDLQTIVCVYTNNLSDIFNNYSDIEQIRKKIEKMWGSDNTPDFSGYVSNINRFKSLISQLTQSHVTQVKQALDFSSLSKTFTSLGNNPSLIFRLLKPLGLVLSGALDSDTVKSALSTADSYFVLPFIKVLEVFHDKGVSVSSLFSDPGSVVKMAEYFGNYRNQLSLSLPIIIQPIFTSLWKEDGFRTAYLCNQSEISPLLHSLKLESIAGVLCNVSSLRWMDTLEEKGVDIVKIYGLAVQLRTALSEYHSKPQCKEECSSSNSCVVTCSASAANPQLSGDVSWFQLITDIERLTDLFQKDSVIVSPSPQNTTMTTFSVVKKILLNDTLSTILTQFKLLHFSGVTLSTDIWSAFRKYISFVSSLNSFFNNLTNKATGKTTLYLRDLLPDSHKVGEVINNIFGRTSAAEFLTATVNPSKFYSLAFTGSWKEIVCDKKKFTEIFKFEVGTDVDTVQRKLCDTATNKRAALKKLVDLFDAKAVLTQLAELFTQSTNSSSDISLFDSVSDISEQLLSSLEKLTQINVDQESVGLWFKPVISTLQAIGNPGINTLNEACDNYFSYINGTEIHRQLEPVMTFLTKVMKLYQASFAITGSTGELSCDLFSKFDLLAVMRKLKEIGFWDIFKTINSLFDNKEQVKCSDMTDSVYSLVQSVNSSTQNRYFTGNTCPHSTNVSTVLGSLSQVLQFSSDMFNILQDSSIRQLLSKQDKLLPVLEFIFSVMSQQKTVILHMSDVLQRIEGKRPEIYLKEMLNLSPEIIKSFLNSAVNLNTTGFVNKTTEEIEKVLCNETLLSSLMTLPEFSPINMSSLMRFVCTDRVRETALAIKSSIDTWEIFNQIAALTNLDINQVWFTNISTHIADVISNIDTISNLTSLFSNGFSVEKVRDSLPVIDKFILSSGPDRLVQNLQNVLDDIKHVIRNKDANMVIEDMKTFIDGVMGLGVVQSRLIEIIRVGDFLENPVEVKKYLEDLGIPKSVAVSILEGKYSLGIFLNMSSLDVGCSELFGNLIHPNTTAVQISELTRLFCSLNESMAIELSKKLVPNLNIGDLLKKYITMDTASMFEEVGVTKDELKDFTDKMSKAHNSLLRSTDFIKSTNNKTSEKFQELIHELVNLPQAQTASQSMSSMRPLLCGKSDKPLVEDAFQLKSFIDNQDTNEATDFFIKINTSSNSSLPEEDFCDEMFADIKKTTFGPIILAYLKPIMQGKILFSPNTKLTQSIVKKANRVFEIIEQVKNISNAWATGGPSLSSIIDQGADLQPLKKVLDNEFVKSLFKSSAGLNLDELMTGLDSLNSNTVNKTNIDSLTTAAKLVNNYITCLDLDRFVAMETEEELLKEAFKLSKSSRFLAGIVFDLPSGGRKKREAVDSEIPKHISYKIRMDTDNVRITNRMKSRIWYPDPESNFAEYMRYLRGFVQLQDIVDRAIISLQTNTDTLPAVYLKQFPFPCHNHDKFIYILGSYLVPVLMTFAWLASLGIITRNLVWDRENGQEVVFRIMGMKSSVNWFAWFMTSMCVMVIICFVITIIFTVSVSEDGEIYRYSNPVLIFFFLLCFCVSSAMMCFMISAFFTRVTLAILTVLIVYIFSYLPYIILFALEVNMQFWQKTIACLSSTTAFGFASMYIARLELTTEGLQWSNVNVSPIVGDPMTFQWACIMMMIDSFIYFIIGWYIRNVKPGKFGVPRPWYFPLTASYWCPRKHTSNSKLKGINGPAVETSKEGLFESAAVHLNVGMSVSGLSKKFGNNLVVNDLTAQFYEGQVTALLGHNGAAKTTTINLLLGLLEPTSGEVHIYNNYSAEGDSMIGVCPQHNALLQYMTVEEHMYLYAGIKCNWSSKQKKLEIQSLLQDVDLWHVRDVVVSTLSGGMQRRLCVALAFVGGSRAIVLDEPTSGIDPSTRKSIWNLISRNKPGRTILLSTHQMDEADNIGDRIIVMHKGQLLCSGSSTFLKQMLGGGYHLTVERALNYNFSSALNSNTKSYCNSQAVLNFIHRFLPSAELVEEVGTEIVIHLPYEDRQVTPFHQFFSELDQNQDSLCISSYGVSDTTLEDVFLKITSLADEGVKITEESLKSRHSQTNTDTISELSQETAGTSADPASRVTGCSLKTQQFAALMLKRLHHYRRDWRSLITIIILPFMLFLMAMGFALIRPSDSDMPSLLITPALYGPDNYMFIKDGYGGSNPVSNKLQTAFTSEPGIGTTCMDDFPSQLKQKFECRSQGRNFTQKPYTLNPEAKCQCWNWQQRCDPGADFPPPPELPEMTGNILQKLEGRDVSDYLLKSFNKFIELRYGGWSVEEAEEDTGNETSVQVWFNNKGYHALPSFFNGYSNALLRANVDPADKPAEFGITTYSHPITLHPLQLSFENLGAQSADAGIALVMLLAYSFIPAALMIYLVNERLHKEKQMQFISGVRPLMYWTAAFIWDLLIYTVTVVLLLVAIAIFRNGAYWEFHNLPATLSLVLLFGWAVIPMMYCTLRLFSSPSSAYMVLFCTNMFIGLVTVILIVVLTLFQNDKTYNMFKSETEILKNVFLIFPQFCLGQGLIDLTSNYFMYKLFIRYGENKYKEPFTFDAIGWKLVALAIEGVVFFILNLLIDSMKESLIRVPHDLLSEVKEDDDVAMERSRVQQHHTKADILVVDDLTKVFKRGKTKFLAVDRLAFGVNKGECFGLLGVNGAGKTTTFRMMTGDIRESAGSVFLSGENISGDLQVVQSVGYCPQDGGLDDLLTGSELLHFHGRLKGLSPAQRNKCVTELLGRLHLHDYADKPVNNYSGGTKRKLSLAIAMIADPPILFLDEPTTGMDPGTRRLAWKCISHTVKSGQSVVLTSHSMSECDALCSRLAIMVNGRFMCLGSGQHLKNKFGDGYTVVMHIQGLSSQRFSVEHLFLSRFPGASVKVSSDEALEGEHQTVMEVSIPRGVTSVAELFSILEQAEREGHISYYSLSQTTLDSVFLSFAHLQADPDVIDQGSDDSIFTDQSQTLKVPAFSNQIYSYTNPQFACGPDDIIILEQKSDNLEYIPDRYTDSEGRMSVKM